MIKVENVTKTFDGFKALDELNLNVEKGSVYGLVGPNGAGKSTIIRHLTGIYRQDSGKILIDGQEVYDNADIKKRIAYIPDDLYFFLNSDKHSVNIKIGTFKSFILSIVSTSTSAFIS